MNIMKGRRRVVAVLLTFVGALSSIAAVIGNQQVAEPYIPSQLRPYLAILPAVFFVVAVLTIQQTQAIAAVRLRFVLTPGFPFHVNNIGETEANEIQIVPIEFDDYPWTAVFDEVGSIAAGKGPELPRYNIRKRELATVCMACDEMGKPADFNGFVVGLGEHILHKLYRSRPNVSTADGRWFAFRSTGLPTRFSIWLLATFYDGKTMSSANHRLDVEFVKYDLTNANCVYVRNTHQGDVVCPTL
jgi:hypothetical protein